MNTNLTPPYPNPVERERPEAVAKRFKRLVLYGSLAHLGRPSVVLLLIVVLGVSYPVAKAALARRKVELLRLDRVVVETHNEGQAFLIGLVFTDETGEAGKFGLLLPKGGEPEHIAQALADYARTIAVKPEPDEPVNESRVLVGDAPLTSADKSNGLPFHWRVVLQVVTPQIYGR